MRTTLLLLLLPSVACAQQVGDTIVVINSTHLKSGNTTVFSVARGLSLRVEAVNGDWFWVERLNRRGWVNRRDVIPLERAVDYFTEAIRRNPTSGNYLCRALAWEARGEPDIALADYNEAIRRDPKDASAYNNRGSIFKDKGEYDRAIADYSEAIRLDPQDAIYYNNRGIAWKDKGEHDRAIADYSEAIRLDPKYAICYNNRGIAWRNKGDFDRAIADCSQAIRIDPKYADAYNERGNALYEKRQYDRALADYSEAIRLDPQDAIYYRNRGLAWDEKGEFDRAIADYNEAIRLDPQDAIYYNDRGVAWRNKGDDDNAIADYSQAIRLDPKYRLAYSNRGIVWARQREYDRAIADYSEAIRLDPKNAITYKNRASTWERKGEYDRAIADLTESIRLDPKYASAYYYRGDCWFKKAEYDKAIADYDHAIRLDPKLVAAYRQRVKIWNLKDEYDRAVGDYSELIRLDPKDADSYNYLAWLVATCPEERCRDGQKAVENAKRACELTEWKNASYVATLAAAYAEAGDFEKALKWLQKAMEIEPGNETREKMLVAFRDGKPYRGREGEPGEDLPAGWRVFAGPALIHVKDDKYDYKVWGYCIHRGPEDRPSAHGLFCQAAEGEDPPTAEEAYDRAKAEGSMASVAFRDPDRPRAEDVHDDGRYVYSYATKNPMAGKVRLAAGDEHIFAFTPTRREDKRTGEAKVLILACPETGRRVFVKQYSSPLPVVSPCAECYATRFETVDFTEQMREANERASRMRSAYGDSRSRSERLFAEPYPEDLPDDARVFVGPTLVHVQKPELGISYKLCVFTIHVGSDENPQALTLASPVAEDGVPCWEGLEGAEMCYDRAKKYGVVCGPAAWEEGKDAQNTWRSGDRTYSYASAFPGYVRGPIGTQTDTICVFLVARTDEGGYEELTHFACSPLPATKNVNGAEIPVCPRITSTEFSTKPMDFARRRRARAR